VALALPVRRTGQPARRDEVAFTPPVAPARAAG
jgi:hypothetical protein